MSRPDHGSEPDPDGNGAAGGDRDRTRDQDAARKLASTRRSGAEYVTAADRELEATYEEPIGLAGYVDRIFEYPHTASHASKYLLEAIEAAGTRTVIEEGEEKRRFEFFDDPHNDGEHAILGNTDVLNRFVDDLRSIAARRGKEEKIVWLEGPTATGKSELKRCLINGLREYSKTDEGRRYTVEWNVAGAVSTRSVP